MQIDKNDIEIKRRLQEIARQNQTTPPQPERPTSIQVEAQDSVVTIKSIPEGAEIMIDGKFVGSTPSTVQLAPGDHEIVIEKKGGNVRHLAGGEITVPNYRAWRRTLTVNPASTLTLDATLERVP